MLKDSVAGELIASEIEIRSGRGEDFADAIAKQREARRRLFALADTHGVALGSTGTHPLSDYRDQRIIDTPHYRRLDNDLRYVAWRNNTWALQVHVGVQGADRAIRVCDRLRPILPLVLAVSANSPYLDGRDSGLHSARTQAFTRNFPRCGIPDAFGSWATWAEYVDLLVRTNSIVEFTQIWWSVRPHHAFGTIEVRICDAQMTAGESDALAELLVACVARAAREVDAGEAPPTVPGRLIEENVWRALRYGLDGRPARPRGPDGRGVPGAGGPRPAAGLDRGRRRAPRAQRRPAPAPADRGGRDARRGLRGVSPRDPHDLLRAGADPMSERELTEEQLAALEAEMDRLSVDDVLLQTIVTLLNLGARKAGLAAPPGQQDIARDLPQVRMAIEGVRALMPLVEPAHAAELAPVRDALSRLQMVYAQLAGGAPGQGPPPPPGVAQPGPPPPPPEAEQEPGGPGPAQRSGRLWVPGQ